MAQVTIRNTFDIALQHHEAGRLGEAERLYRQILTEEPRHVDALHHLGVIAHQVGRNDVAVELIRRAIVLRPYWAEAHSNLGNALKHHGHIDEAIAAYVTAIALNPNLADAHNNLGIALKEKGKLDEAIAACRRAIAINSNYPQAHNNLGIALKENGQLDDAVIAYSQAISLKPDYAEAHYNLAIALGDKGQLDQAIASYRRAIALRPDYADAHNNLGKALKDMGQFDEAAAAFRQAIFLEPELPEAGNNLGNTLREIGSLHEAIAIYRAVLARRPNLPETHMNLGHALRDVGRLDEAIACYRQAMVLNTDLHAAHSALAFSLLFHPGYDTQAISGEHRRWNRQHAEPLRGFIPSHSNDRNSDRRLRIGYVSPDFKDHVVGRNLLPLLHQHDRRQFEITCYAQVPCPDAMTRQFQQNADGWRNIVGLSDEQVANQIREDRIDILVDLALHTANNRLLVFARKPAPVQVSYLGYCGSTGMSAMDYRLSDPYLDPPETDLSCYSEKTLRLPRSYWCYQPIPAPTPSLAPALKNGFVTFGCLNNFAKVSSATLDVWARILAAAPNSRMIIHAPAGEHLNDVAQRFQRGGVAQIA